MASDRPDESPAADSRPTPAPGLLLILDDLHWADKPSLLLVQHLARRLGGAPLLVVLSYRTVELSRTHPLAETLAALSREGLSERLLLGPLTPNETALLITELAGRAAGPRVVEAIQRETEGNPFFVQEVVRHLQSEGRDLADPEAAVAGWSIPEGVRQVIGARLSRLDAVTNQMLQTAVILGDGFSFDVLARASGLE